MPASTSRSSDWPLPATPAMPRISPARTSKLTDFSRATPLSSVSERFSTSSTTGPGFAGALLHPQQHPPPDHQLGQLGRAGLGGGERLHHLAAAHDADLVGHRHDLAQLVGDEDDRLPLRLQVLEDAEEVVGLGRGQHAGRLVEDQDVALAVERLQDLHPLLQPDRELAHHRVGVDLELVLLLEPLQLRPRLGERGAQQPPVLGAEDDVLEHGEGLDQHEVLMHHADPGADRRQAVGDRRRACRRCGSRRRRPGRSRRGSTSASTCRRRSRRRCRGWCRGGRRGGCPGWPGPGRSSWRCRRARWRAAGRRPPPPSVTRPAIAVRRPGRPRRSV